MTTTGRLNAVDVELVGPAVRIDADITVGHNLIAGLRQPRLRHGAALPHHGIDGGPFVLEAEVDMAAGRPLPGADLGRYRDVAQQIIGLEQSNDVGCES